MFDELEKILIDEVFNEKIEEMKEELNKNFNKYGGLEVAIQNDIEALKNAYDKIKKLF